jgi:uncharacterized protein
MFSRWYYSILKSKLNYPYVHILFGARQTGKSTLINSLLPSNTLRINLADPVERSRYAANPLEFQQRCRIIPVSDQASYVFVDEAQYVPTIFDSVQHLYDSNKERWRFILCGSSARRLRKSGANLLPGRAIVHRLFPLTLAEQPALGFTPSFSPLPFSWPNDIDRADVAPDWSLEERLAWGGLPGIVSAPPEVRADVLKSYAAIHLEEEIRREAYIKDWPAFVRFIHLAAAESGKMINYASIANQSGISQPTVKAYYQLLEDMFIGFTVPAFTRSIRKNILSTGRFFICDTGIRHAAAGLTPSIDTVLADPGPVFEQWVGTELWKRLNYLGRGKLFYQKARTGAEVDFILDLDSSLVPIEVKWTDRPTPRDARHVQSFLDEYDPQTAPKGYLVCRCPHPLQLSERISAIPWQCL